MASSADLWLMEGHSDVYLRAVSIRRPTVLCFPAVPSKPGSLESEAVVSL
jgi:hypothetical protein